MGWKPKVAVVRVVVQRALNVPFEYVTNRMVCAMCYVGTSGSITYRDSKRAGSARPCFVSSLMDELSNAGKNAISDEDMADVKGAAGTLYVGKSICFIGASDVLI